MLLPMSLPSDLFSMFLALIIPPEYLVLTISYSKPNSFKMFFASFLVNKLIFKTSLIIPISSSRDKNGRILFKEVSSQTIINFAACL